MTALRFALVAVLAVLGCDSPRPPPSPPASATPPAAAASAPASASAPAPASSVRVTATTESFTTRAGRCAADITIPALSGLADRALEARVNQTLRDRLTSSLPAPCDGPRDPRPARKSARCADLPPEGTTDLVIGYDLGVARPDLLSLRYTRSVCANPSLHPDELRAGITLDLRTGATLELSQLFRPGAAWERTLLDLAQRDVAKKAPEAKVTALDPRAFHLTEREIVLANVVPGRAFAALSAQVSLVDLAGLLREDGPVRALVEGRR